MNEDAKEFTVINDQSAADFLLQSKHRHYLYPFLEQERSLSEVSELLEVNLSSLYHHVKKMLAYGLIEESGLGLRNKKKVKLYKAVKDAFIVPLTATSSSTLESHLQDIAFKDATDMGKMFAASMLTVSKEWGFYIELGDKGLRKEVIPRRPTEDAILDDPYPTFWFTTSYFLDDDDTYAFTRELEALAKRYKQKSLENDGMGNAQKVVLFSAPEKARA